MRVIKTQSKQIELAKLGLLFIIVNCAYLKVSPSDVVTMQGIRFYSRAK